MPTGTTNKGDSMLFVTSATLAVALMSDQELKKMVDAMQILRKDLFLPKRNLSSFS
jgi:hypothetical protein